MKLTALQRANLEAVGAYQERYGGVRMWAGWCGSNQDTLDELVGLELVNRLRSENGTRWWYGLTAAGLAELGDAGA